MCSCIQNIKPRIQIKKHHLERFNPENGRQIVKKMGPLGYLGAMCAGHGAVLIPVILFER